MAGNGQGLDAHFGMITIGCQPYKGHIKDSSTVIANC